MSYTLLQEKHVKHSKKKRPCIWCGQSINIGDAYIYESSIYDSCLQSHHWHHECKKASNTYFLKSREEEFMPYENERPTTVLEEEK